MPVVVTGGGLSTKQAVVLRQGLSTARHRSAPVLPMTSTEAWDAVVGTQDVMERILKYLTAKEWGCAALTRRVAAQIINAIVTHVQAQSYMPGAPQSALQTTAT
jgi:hypothetical protein